MILFLAALHDLTTRMQNLFSLLMLPMKDVSSVHSSTSGRMNDDEDEDDDGEEEQEDHTPSLVFCWAALAISQIRRLQVCHVSKQTNKQTNKQKI
jgi:hypothetical protein